MKVWVIVKISTSLRWGGGGRYVLEYISGRLNK